MKTLTSIGPANRITRSEETHPLTWRLRDDAQPVWLAEYQAKNGYAAARKAFADRLEAILRRHIRNFDAIKIVRRAYSPADLEEMNCNLVGGDPYGGHCGIDQFFIWRPFAHSTNGTSAVRGLIQIGASTHPGPGLGGGSGFNAAKRLGA